MITPLSIDYSFDLLSIFCTMFEKVTAEGDCDSTHQELHRDFYNFRIHT